MAEAAKKNGIATASLVLGILSIVLFLASWVAVILGILAIIFGVVAKNKIKADPELPGAGAAKTGLITGIIGIVLAIVVIVLAIMAAKALMEGAINSQEFDDAMRELNNMQ